MTFETPEGMGNVEALVRAGLEQVQVIEVEDQPADLLIVARPDSHTIDQFDLSPYLPNPRRAAGAVSMADEASFAAYVNKYASASSIIYAHDDGSMVAVLDDHTAEAPGWRGHRATLSRALLRPFREWQAIESRPMGQYDFANFLEDHLSEIAAPDGATLLETAQNFKAHRTLRFRSENRLRNGQAAIVAEEQLEGGAEGTGGEVQLTLPAALTALLKPYTDAEPFPVDARIRWGLRERAVTFTLRFPELQERLDEVHAAAVERIRGLCPNVLVVLGRE